MTKESVKPSQPDQQQPSQPDEQQDAVALLVQAVNQLAPPDRDKVFAWLLRVGWRHYTPSAAMVSLDPPDEPSALLRIFQAAKPGSARAGQAAAQQMVPVRFPADQHAQLREWCTQHGFSMATVIRGLVAKFLEDQGPEHN
jgi:hypothetical protein